MYTKIGFYVILFSLSPLPLPPPSSSFQSSSSIPLHSKRYFNSFYWIFHSTKITVALGISVYNDDVLRISLVLVLFIVIAFVNLSSGATLLLRITIKRKHFCLLTYFIKIKWKISGNRTIQTRFQKWCPTISKSMRSSFIPFANTCDTWENRLQVKTRNQTLN